MTTQLLRVLVGIESSGPGGAENMVVSLATGLSQIGHFPRIVTDKPGWMTDRAADADVPVWVETQRRGLEWLWILQLARRMRREKIDVYHSHEFSMNVFGGVAAWLARVPHVATIHGRSYVTDAPRRVAAYRTLHKIGVPIVAVSDDLRNFLGQGFRLERNELIRIHNGIPIPTAPLNTPNLLKDSRRQARELLGIPHATTLLVCVGNLYPVKDHATLLRALPQVPDVDLAIAGRGDEEQNLRSLAAELGISHRLHLLGLRDDVGTVLSAADIFVHPSRSEGLPLAVLEAMGHQLPIVASGVGGIPEAIDDGRTGILVAARDPDALAQALKQLVDSPATCAELGTAARARAETEFSIDTMVKRYLKLYLETARQSAPQSFP